MNSNGTIIGEALLTPALELLCMICFPLFGSVGIVTNSFTIFLFLRYKALRKQVIHPSNTRLILKY